MKLFENMFWVNAGDFGQKYSTFAIPRRKDKF